METFTLLRRHLAMCGISMSQQSSRNHPFNVKNMTICLTISVAVTFIVVLLNEPNTFDECTDILLRSAMIATAGVIYVIIVWKTSKLCEFLINLEAIVNASEWKSVNCSIQYELSDLKLILCTACRTGIFETANILHRNRSKSGQRDWNSSHCLLKSHANRSRINGINLQFLHLLYHRFRWISF